MTFHDQKKSNSMTFRTILGNEHIRSKYGNFKEQLNASFKPQIVNKTLLYGNLHITTHNINNKITEIKLVILTVILLYGNTKSIPKKCNKQQTINVNLLFNPGMIQS